MNLAKAPLQLLGKALLAVLLISQFSQSARAGASNKNGNPYGNGTFFQTAGTFSAVVRGENLSGTMLFSTGVSTNALLATPSSGGTCTIIYQGYTYQGNASGIWDPSSGSVNGEFWGGQTLSGSNAVSVYPEIYNTNLFPVLINIVTNQILTNSVPVGTNIVFVTTNVLLTNTINVMPQGSNYFQDSLYMNGSFNGQMQNQYPNQTFNAQGTITQQQLYPQQITNTTTNGEGTQPVQMSAPLNITCYVQGVRISDSYTSFNTISNAIPYSFTAYTITNIPAQQGGL
jgi:hypothetical protein